MLENNTFGERLALSYGLEHVPSAIARTRGNANLVLAETRCDELAPLVSKPPHREDAFLFTLQLRDFPGYQCWEDGRAAPAVDVRSGELVLADLNRSPSILLDKPFHSVHFYLPRGAIDEISEDERGVGTVDIVCQPGKAFQDPVMRSLVDAVSGAIGGTGGAERLLIDDVALAMGVHALRTYGASYIPLPPTRGGLAPWQERRATEMLNACLGKDIGIRELATECGLSGRHFSRAFKRSTGLSPYAWLQHRRIGKAFDLLREGHQTLAEIAISCGYFDQSHFTRIFSNLVGVSPGAWRQTAAPKGCEPLNRQEAI